MKLTNEIIENLQPKEKPYKKFDENGLYIYVHPTGTKSWRMKYYKKGKEYNEGFGTYPNTSLEEARKKALLIKKLLRNKIKINKILGDEKKESILEEPIQLMCDHLVHSERLYKTMMDERMALEYRLKSLNTQIERHREYLKSLYECIEELGQIA